MSEPTQTFVQRVLEGLVLEPSKAIDDEVDAWHESDSPLDLHEWLGMTSDEYALFVERPASLSLIFRAHRFGLDVLELLSRESDQPVSIAARGAESENIAELVQWLRRTGRMPK